MTFYKFVGLLVGLILTLIILNDALALPEKCTIGELYFNTKTKQTYICCPPSENNFWQNVEMPILLIGDDNETKTEGDKGI